jgi:hypothetical protein
MPSLNETVMKADTFLNNVNKLKTPLERLIYIVSVFPQEFKGWVSVVTQGGSSIMWMTERFPSVVIIATPNETPLDFTFQATILNQDTGKKVYYTLEYNGLHLLAEDTVSSEQIRVARLRYMDMVGCALHNDLLIRTNDVL